MFGLGKSKVNFKFEIGDEVEYTGTVKKMKGDYTIHKRHHEKGEIHYTCIDAKGKKHDISQSVLDESDGLAGLGNKKVNYQFHVGDVLKYVGENPKMKREEYEVMKRHCKNGKILYTCMSSETHRKLDISEGVLDYTMRTLYPDMYEDWRDEDDSDLSGLGKLKAKYTIQDVDKLARKIQHGSGVKMEKTITHYNISHKEAKKKAFAEIKKMTKYGKIVSIK